MDLLKSFAELCFGNFSLARSPFPEGVCDRKELVKNGIAQSRKRNRAIQRFESDSARGSLRKRPDGDGVVPFRNQCAHGRRGIGCRESTSKLASLCWEDVFQAVNEELMNGSGIEPFRPERSESEDMIV
jgi:hypothetical protein